MKIPKTLKIGAHTVTVIVTDKIEADDQGEFDCDTNTIKISKALAPSRKAGILLHEIFHALNDTFGYEEVDDKNGIDHMFLDSLAQQLYQVLHDNKLRF